MPLLVCDISEMKRRVTYSGVHRVVQNIISTIPERFSADVILGFLDADGQYHFADTDGNPLEVSGEFGLFNLDLTLDFSEKKARQIARWGRKMKFMATFLPDVLPMASPAYFEPEMAVLFRKYFQIIARRSDLILTNSQDSIESIESFLSQDETAEARPRIDRFQLGTDFLPVPIGDLLQVRRPIWEAVTCASQPVFSWLSTIEPRKNLATVLSAVEILAQEGKPFKLIVMGKFGWHCDFEFFKLQELLHKYPKHLQFLHFPSDFEIRYVLTKSLGLIVSSFAEGFGLPLIEGAALGNHVICSDIPVFRSIMGKSGIYFDPDSVHDLVTRMRHVMELSPLEPGTHEVKPANWNEISEELFSKIFTQMSQNQL